MRHVTIVLNYSTFHARKEYLPMVPSAIEINTLGTGVEGCPNRNNIAQQVETAMAIKQFPILDTLEIK